jgi:hypothetical protein
MVIIEKILSYDHINGPSDKTTFFGANQSSVQFVDVNVRFENLLMPSTLDSLDLPMFFIQTRARSEFTGNPQRSNTIHTNRAGGWVGVNVGDDYTIVNSATSNSTGKVLAISANNLTLFTDQTYAVLETLPLNTAYIAFITPQKSIEYLFNLIENLEPANYVSKVDGDSQRSIVGGLTYTDTVTEHVATMMGNRSWHFGSITVKGNDIGGGDSSLVAGVSQAFTITHELIVGPLFLFDQWDDTQNRIKPDWLINDNSFKYITQIGLSAQENNPNDIVVVDEDESLGNVGWFNENLNGKPNDYSFTTPIYRRADTTVIESLELTTNLQTIEWFIDNTESASFSDGNTKVIVGHNFAPSDKSQYRDIVASTTKTMEYNFVFDQVVETLGSGGVAIPRQEGLGNTDLQVIKNAVTTIISTTRIKVVVSVQMASDVVSRISANGIRRYMLYAETANHTLNRASTDKVQLLIDANDYFTDVTDDGMIVMEQSILRHPFSDVETETEQFVDLFKEADFVGVNNFYIDKLTREADEIILTGVTNEVIAIKTTGAGFVLDGRSKNLSAFPQVEYPNVGTISNVNFEEPRGFKTPVDELRANMKLNRVYASDTADRFYFLSTFPPRTGWNGYTALENVNNEFFDSNEPNDGENNDWIRYDEKPDWSIIYRTTINALKNGDPLTYQKDTTISTFDYLAGDEWDTEEILSFDENDVLLTGFGITYADGKLQANFTFIGVTMPTLSDIVIDFHLYVFEEGTFKSIYTISSAYSVHTNSLFKSIEVTDQGGGVFRAEAITDGAKIGVFNKAKFQASALIYDKRDEEPPPPPAVPKIKEGGTFKKKEGNNGFKIKE